MITINTGYKALAFIQRRHYHTSVFKNFRVRIISYTSYFYEIKTPRIFILRHFFNTKLTRSTVVALTGLPIGYSIIVALTGLPIGYSIIVALTGLPIGYSVIVALTGLPIGYSVIVALTGLPIGYSSYN